MKRKPAEEEDDGIEWGDEPPEGMLPCIKIERVPAKGTVEAILLSDAVLGVRTHYGYKKTIPHLKNKAACEGCTRKLPIRWRGYVYGLVGKEGILSILEITYMGFVGCPELRKLAGDLFGRTLRQSRKGDRHNGQQVNAVGEKRLHAPRKGIPPLSEVLKNIWNGEAQESEEPDEHGG